MTPTRAAPLLAALLCFGPLAPAASLPTAPAGFTLREVTRFDGNVCRVCVESDGSLLALSTEGNVWHVTPSSGDKQLILEANSYFAAPGSVLGICRDRAGRLYIVANHPDSSVEPLRSHVTVYRTEASDRSAKPIPWFHTTYPLGVDTFNHAASRVACGPDGLIYVSSGSRTDHGEARHQEHRSTEGECPMTGCIWRLNPDAPHPEAEIFAAGLRNAFGFCFDDHGTLWATENGPNGEAPEELNRILRGHHYGFPYRFADQPASLYPDQPGLPANLSYDLPVLNLGPDAGANLSTFNNHSSPSGIVPVHFPAPWGDGLLVARFGNLIGSDAVGFDLVHVSTPVEKDGRLTAHVRTFLPHVGRPTDLATAGDKIYIAVYDTQTSNLGEARVNEQGGRILELTVPPHTSP